MLASVHSFQNEIPTQCIMYSREFSQIGQKQVNFKEFISAAVEGAGKSEICRTCPQLESQTRSPVADDWNELPEAVL